MQKEICRIAYLHFAPDMVSLFLADRSEIHILPEGGNLKLYFRIGGAGYDDVMQRYSQLKDASLALIKQYLGGLK